MLSIGLLYQWAKNEQWPLNIQFLKKAADGGWNVEVSQIASCGIMKFVTNNILPTWWTFSRIWDISIKIKSECFRTDKLLTNMKILSYLWVSDTWFNMTVHLLWHFDLSPHSSTLTFGLTKPDFSGHDGFSLTNEPIGDPQMLCNLQVMCNHWVVHVRGSPIHYVQNKCFVQIFRRFAKLYIFGKFRIYWTWKVMFTFFLNTLVAMLAFQNGDYFLHTFCNISASK